MSKSNGSEASPELSPFDPRRLRLSHQFSGDASIRRVLTTVPVRKPNRQEFFRVHSSEEMRLEVAILDYKVDRQAYLVDPAVWPELPGETAAKMLYTTVTREGILLLWPVRLSDEHGRLDEWNASAHEAADRAERNWVCIKSNMALGAYDVHEALGQFPEPEWPDLSFEKILEIAFRGRFIDSLDHIALRRLRGEL